MGKYRFLRCYYPHLVLVLVPVSGFGWVGLVRGCILIMNQCEEGLAERGLGGLV